MADEDYDRIVSYSELASYRQCPLKHELEYNQRWTKPQREDGALARGSAWHAILEDHYRAMMLAQNGKNSPELRMRAAIQAGRKRLATMRNDVNYPLLVWMYDGYLERYPNQAAEWHIQSVERKFVAPLPDLWKKRPEGSLMPRIGIKVRLDLVVRDMETGGLWVVDHKSGADLPTQQDLEIDDQFGLYVAILRDLDYPIMGAIHSASRTKMNQGDDPEFAAKTARMIEARDALEKGEERTALSRQIASRRNSKPQTLDQRFSHTYLNRTDAELESIKRDAAAVAAVMTWPGLPLYSSPDPRSCGWKCSFKEAHLTMREGRKMDQTMREYGFEQDFTRH
jgi:hypothetical protein